MKRKAYSAGPRLDIPRGTIPQLFFETIDAFDKPDALKHRLGGVWRSISHRRIGEQVRALAAGLESLGLERGDRVGILSENRPEWLLSDLACAVRGLISVPLYPMLPADQLDFMLEDSEARAVLVSTSEQLQKIRAIRSRLPKLGWVVTYDAVPSEFEGVLGLSEVRARGEMRAERESDDSYRSRVLKVAPDDTLTMLYTSGTTGRPKGVLLSHDNLVSNVRSVLEVLSIGPDDMSLSYLPLSHIFERMAGQYALFSSGATICYAESVSDVASYLREVRPTVMTSVPRGYEKMWERMQDVAEAGSAFKERILRWAWDVGVESARRELAGARRGVGQAALHAIADRWVFSKLRDATGGRIRFFVSGGAPLNPDLARFFHSANLPILQGYGLTETSPVVTTNTLEEYRIGSVGQPIPNVEVAIREDGEIVTRGPHVMQGYRGLPEESAAAIDPEGWFYTGDIGEIDEDGFLYVTDRKKELIKTSGGKYVAPQPIETRVTENRWVQQAVVVGDRRKFPAVLVVPDFEALERWARANGVEVQDRAELVRDPRIVAFLESEVLGSLEDSMARYERPKKLAILPSALTLEGGELTPTLKVKRRVVEEKYADRIEELYEGVD